jgi:hypothetical protein
MGRASAASEEGADPNGRRIRPNPTLLYLALKAGTSAERHILHTLMSGTFLRNRAKSVGVWLGFGGGSSRTDPKGPEPESPGLVSASVRPGRRGGSPDRTMDYLI